MTMSNLLKFRTKLLQNITFVFQRWSQPNWRLTFFKFHVTRSFWCCSARNFSDVVDKSTVLTPDNNDAISLDTKIITKGDPELERKLKVLFLEVEILRQEGDKVPSTIRTDHWKELINMATRSMRKRFLSFLWKNEIKRLNEKHKKEEKKKVREEELRLLKEQPCDGHIQYGLSRNTIFLRVYDSTITHFDNCRLIQAMQYSQKIVVDCGYDQHMNHRESMNCAKQLMLLFSENRFHQHPFNLYFCNVNRNGPTMKELNKYIATLYDDNFPLNISEESYLDLFPKQNLVYLTPHCREEMVSFDHDAVYIIGGMVDKMNSEPLSLAKAKKEGLRMAKLPLDRYLTWGSGSGKSLTLNHMIKILLDLRITEDWKTALQHVPRRKIVQFDREQSEQHDHKGKFRKKLYPKHRTISFN